VHWPNFLHFLHLDQHPSDGAARKIATYVPSVKVVRLQTSHYNVVGRRATGRPIKVEEWMKRTGIFLERAARSPRVRRLFVVHLQYTLIHVTYKHIFYGKSTLH